METQISSIGQLVSQVGYPIVSAVALAFWAVLQEKQQRAERKEEREAHAAERKEEREAHLAAMRALTEEVKANTLATRDAVSSLAARGRAA